MTQWGQPDRAISGVGGFMAAALCAVISGHLVADMFGDRSPNSGLHGPSDASVEPAQAAAAAPAEMTHETPATVPTDWTPLLWVLGTVAVLVLAVLVLKRLADQETLAVLAVATLDCGSSESRPCRLRSATGLSARQGRVG